MSFPDYVSRPKRPSSFHRRATTTDEREEWEKDKPGIHELEVTEDPEYVETGLVGADGAPIYRRNRWPVGFHHQ